MALRIRRAAAADAEAAVALVRRSITELCEDDHHRDPATLTQWLANKTPEHFRRWIDHAENFCVVAEGHGGLSGVGLLHNSGEVRLFYLDPSAQRQGIGTAIHRALEDHARALGLTVLTLDSSANARRFYERIGYRSAGAAKPAFGVLHTYPYEKRLQSK